MTTNKGALNLIASYGGDSSDDEVPGCRVSTKRTHKDSEEEDDQSAKKSIRLPLPNITVKGCVYEDHSDNSVLHEGRVRSFPHERGNWATYAYIPYDLDINMHKIVNELAAVMPGIPIKPIDDFHISLTRTVVLRHHWIEPFVQSIKQQLSHIKRFLIILDNIRIYCNDERTRTFIGLQVLTGYDTLSKCVDILDSCLEEFKLPPFYKNRSFHMSIAWCVGDYEQEINASLLLLNQKLHESIRTLQLDYISIFVSAVNCKIGNKICTFSLSQ